MKRVQQLVIVLALLYAVGLIVFAALAATTIERFWWMQVGNMFALLLFAPLLLLLPLAVFVKSWALRGAVVVALLLFVVQFWPVLRPVSGSVTNAADLRIATLNQFFYNQNVDEVVAVIRAQDADIVALQELSPSVAEAIESQLDDEYPYRLLQPEGSREGMGILSRYPLSDVVEDYRFRNQWVTVDVAGQAVTVINVHLPAPFYEVRCYSGVPVLRGYDTSSRGRNIDRMLAAIEDINGPLVLLGDFNTSDREPHYQRIASELEDVYRTVAWGPGFTFPERKSFGPIVVPVPLLRIDYVWVRGGIDPVAAHIDCDNGGADHCLVVADLAIEGATARRK